MNLKSVPSCGISIVFVIVWYSISYHRHFTFLRSILFFFLSLTINQHNTHLVIFQSSCSSGETGELIGDDKTSDTGGGEGGQDTRDESRDGKTGNVTTSRGSELAENTDLDTEGADVAETAESVGGDELRAGGEAVELGGLVGGGEGGESIVLVLERIVLLS